MKTKKIYLVIAAAACLMINFNANATQATSKATPMPSTPISSGGVAPSGLTDDQFKAITKKMNDEYLNI